MAAEKEEKDQNNDIDDSKQDVDVNPSKKTTLKLSNGDIFPRLGFGTSWRRGISAYWGAAQHEIWNNDTNVYDSENVKSELDKLQSSMVIAIKNGYKLIDTAQGYTTEQLIGNILTTKEYGIKREDIFISTKLGSNERTIQECKSAVENSLKLLRTDYIDLYLIHSPDTDDDGMDVINIYKYLSENYKSKGIIKHLGVSNFGIKHLKCLKIHKLETPEVNQIAFGVFMNHKELVAYCKENGIIVQGYAPLFKASERVKKNKLLLQIAGKYKKEWSDICLKYCYQKEVAVVVQSMKEGRIKQNYNAFFNDDWKISDEDMERLDTLNKLQIEVAWGRNPIHIEWDIFDKLKE